MKHKIFILIIFCNYFGFSQQQPQYTQYMYNMRIVNPGYMINLPGIIEVGGLYRSQWINIKGAPKTANIFASIPLRNNIELGLNYLNDKIGSHTEITTNSFNVDGAYKIALSDETNLSFGLKSGVTSIGLNLSDSGLSDPAISNHQSKLSFNLGAGLFLFNPNYYVGFSSPNIISGNVKSRIGNYKNNVHFYLIGGYVFEMSSDVKIKPSFVVKKSIGAPISFDISTNVLVFDKFELGASYRHKEAFAGLASFFITPYLRVGYSYDLGINELSKLSSGSHEFILLYQFDLLGLSKKYISPRFY